MRNHCAFWVISKYELYSHFDSVNLLGTSVGFVNPIYSPRQLTVQVLSGIFKELAPQNENDPNENEKGKIALRIFPENNEHGPTRKIDGEKSPDEEVPIPTPSKTHRRAP